MMTTLLALLLTTVKVGDCTFTTNVPEFANDAPKACADSTTGDVTLLGDRERLSLTMRYTFSMAGRQIAATRASRDSLSAAHSSWEYVSKAYGPKHYEIHLQDVSKREFCEFAFEAGKDAPVTARCVVSLK